MLSTAPRGTTHRRRRQPCRKEHPQELPEWQPCTSEELKGLDKKCAKQFNWKNGPRVFQMEGINAQLQFRDVLIHAGTGLGKTAIAAGPHVYESAKRKITIMVSPLIALHDEMVETFHDEFKLSATAVNSSNGGCAPKTLKVESNQYQAVLKLICWQKIVKGEWQIILISPELLLSRRFIKEVLKDPEFKQRILLVVIDEAHVISHWGGGFRKKYGELGIIRSFLPKSTPIVAVSATLPARVRRDVLRVLRFDQNNYESIDVGNDRPNVSIVIRGIQESISSYADLDFVIQKSVKNAADIQKTFIYCDNVAMGIEIEDHVTELLPENLRQLGIIRPYNASFSKEYRKAVMDAFRNSTVRILICTDAAGMGCNIPDIDLVVQWKLPESISSFVQRAGRTILDEHGQKPNYQDGKAGKKKKKTSMPTNDETKAKRLYAESRGIKRGAVDGKHDNVLVQDCPAIDAEAADEGVLSLVQSGKCRRGVLTHVYGNKPAQPTVPCCDICCPSLLDRTRPGLAEKAPRQKKVVHGPPSELVHSELHAWRVAVKKRDFEYSFFSFEALLPGVVVDILTSAGRIATRDDLTRVLAGQWGWETTYGDDVYSHLASLDLPDPIPTVNPTTTKSSKARGVKRALLDNDDVSALTKKPKSTLPPPIPQTLEEHLYEFRLPMSASQTHYTSLPNQPPGTTHEFTFHPTIHVASSSSNT